MSLGDFQLGHRFISIVELGNRGAGQHQRPEATIMDGSTEGGFFCLSMDDLNQKRLSTRSAGHTTITGQGRAEP